MARAAGSFSFSYLCSVFHAKIALLLIHSHQITIRKVSSADLDWLHPFARRIFCEAYERYYTPEQFWGYTDWAFSQEQWQQELTDERNAFHVAWVEGQPAGYIKLSHGQEPASLSDQSLLEVGRLYVDAPFHGRGIAQQLMDLAHEVGKDQGFDGLWLVVWQQEGRALSFYRKNGFEPVGTYFFEMGDGLIEEDFLMRKLWKGTKGV